MLSVNDNTEELGQNEEVFLLGQPPRWMASIQKGVVRFGAFFVVPIILIGSGFYMCIWIMNVCFWLMGGDIVLWESSEQFLSELLTISSVLLLAGIFWLNGKWSTNNKYCSRITITDTYIEQTFLFLKRRIYFMSIERAVWSPYTFGKLVICTTKWTRITVMGDFLGKDDRIRLLMLLHDRIPIEKQKNWSMFRAKY